MNDHPELTDSAVQGGRHRLIATIPIGRVGTERACPDWLMLEQVNERTVLMMGDNPALPRMPDKPQLLDFFQLRFDALTRNHLLSSAKCALQAGHAEKIVLACLLHDISVACLMRTDHGYWGAQMIRPYVSEEIAWAVEAHQALSYFADPSVGYSYPETYQHWFGADYQPPEYICRAARAARQHRWYMSGRLITLHDTYSFADSATVDAQIFTDIIGRHFKAPDAGLGFDGSPVAHMWRSIIWPNNFL